MNHLGVSLFAPLSARSPLKVAEEGDHPTTTESEARGGKLEKESLYFIWHGNESVPYS
jgi:hypothetical protein